MANNKEMTRLVTFSRSGGNAVVYLKHTLLSMLVIAPAALTQAANYYSSFDPHFFLMPLVVSVVVGFLLGRSALLKTQLQE